MSYKTLVATLGSCEGMDETVLPDANEVNSPWCLRFLRAIREVSLATVDENGLPSVRIIDVMAVSENRLYFLVPRGKALHGDIMREGYVALVGQTPDFRTCRLRGKVVRPADDEQHALVDAMFELNPKMSLIYPGETRYICDVFYIAEGQGEYFDLCQKPIFRKSFVLGQGLERVQNYIITNACVACGQCAEICPEACIVQGTSYLINQNHCLKCGLCAERCPITAIVLK